jgi:hypothetical protein
MCCEQQLSVYQLFEQWPRVNAMKVWWVFALITNVLFSFFSNVFFSSLHFLDQWLGFPQFQHGLVFFCYKPSLGLTTKARVCNSVSQKGSPWVTSHAFRSAGGCEGMNPHTPKRAPTLGVGVPMDSWIFKKQWKGSNPIGLRHFLYHWKSLRT